VHRGGRPWNSDPYLSASGTALFVLTFESTGARKPLHTDRYVHRQGERYHWEIRAVLFSLLRTIKVTWKYSNCIVKFCSSATLHGVVNVMIGSCKKASVVSSFDNISPEKKPYSVRTCAIRQVLLRNITDSPGSISVRPRSHTRCHKGLFCYFFFLFLSFIFLIGWQLSIWNCCKPFLSLLYNCQLLCLWWLAFSTAVQVFPQDFFQIFLLHGCLL
jgi:hypothetical protein